MYKEAGVWWEIRTKRDFNKAWENTPNPKQCYAQRHTLGWAAVVWSGDENRFGDMPGRVFSRKQVLLYLD